MKKLCLCGSTKYRNDFEAMNKELTLRGYLVYSVAVFRHSGDPITPSVGKFLDLVHLRKIMESDAIVIVGKYDDGSAYIGEGTAREIAWARMLGKEIFYQEDVELGKCLKPLVLLHSL